MEQKILGMCLLEHDAYHTASLIINAECFNDPVCKEIWRAMDRVKKKGRVIDVLTVNKEMAENNSVECDAFYICKLTEKVTSAATLISDCACLLSNYYVSIINKQTKEIKKLKKSLKKQQDERT